MLKTAYTIAFGAPLLGLALWAGSASAGTVSIDCSCNPENSQDGCTCENSQGISALATNEYERRCKVTQAYAFIPQWYDLPGPKTQVRDIPGGVTCTQAQSYPPPPFEQETPKYIWNDCTNWNWSKKSVTVLTYCWWDGN